MPESSVIFFQSSFFCQKRSVLRLKTQNTLFFRKKIISAGFDVKEGSHPIIPILLGDALLSKKFAEELLSKNIYVISFSYPVVPKGQARIRVQISASHTVKHLKKAINGFISVGKNYNII